VIPEREALYQAGIHVGVRVVIVVFGLAMLLTALRICWLAVTDRKWAVLAILPAVIGFIGLVSYAVFSTEAVYGTPAGVQIRGDGAWETIPWSSVGTAHRAWWSVNPVFRVTALPVVGRAKPILFFSSPEKLEALETLRAKAVEAKPGPTVSHVTGAR
jgi:hypothetical protein